MPDVIIIGGGPAGSALAAYLAKAKVDHVLFEKSLHPRPHVGESLLPSTTRIFEELGFLETMEQAGFPYKFGASWHPPRVGSMVAVEFAEIEQPGINQPHTYHVDRGKFDLLLLKHAESLGANIVEGVHVREVLFDGERACGVRVRMAGQDVDVPARIVVDASGRNTVLGRQLRLKENDEIFDQFAVHGWFEGVERGDGPKGSHIHIYFLPIKRGWVWQIPVSEDVTSIGVVAEREVFRESAADVERFFLEHVTFNPDLEHALRNARRINELKSEGDYSYCMSRFVGDGYLLVGDAARFVDPIFSSGVSVALYSAKFASQCIVDALQHGSVDAARFEPYEDKIREGVSVWYEFIRLYYKLMPVFTRFMEHGSYRLQCIQLLQGEVFDRDRVAGVLHAMRSEIAAVEKSENHLLKGLLTDIRID